jgi:predicted transcriptional regulator
MAIDHQELLEMTAELAKSYVANNPLSSGELPDLIRQIHQSLTTAGGEAEAPKPEPAISVRRSIKKDQIICIECGKGHKTLKRHLRTAHDLTADEYRQRWNLPHDYPVVAPDYAEQRSKLAKKIGLGRKPGAKGKRRKKAA